MVPIKASFCFGFKLFPFLHTNQASLRCFNNITLDEIKRSIPKRIERGPTDILKALSNTHKRDPTAFEYKFMDDPYFYPLTSNAKRIHSFSLESGRKSARWIVKQYPQLFDHKVSDPFIKALAPKTEYNEDSEVFEETLLGVIEGRNVSDAILIYSLLKKKGVEISNDTKQLLLELVCFHNCEQLFDKQEYEANWYRTRNPKSNFKTWKDKGFAEELFKDINSDCSLAYSTLIQGMLKYGQIDEAGKLYNEAKEKNLKFTVGVYNALIEKSTSFYQASGEIWHYIISLLHEIRSNQLMPNIYTLNGILRILQRKEMQIDRKKISINLLNEFENIGITPSLGTYFHLLYIMCTQRNDVEGNILYLRKILAQIPKNKIEVQHPDDLNFFFSAMFFCEKLNDTESANNLLSLYGENNQHLMGGAINEMAFFKSYMSILINNEPIEYTMKVYSELIPASYNLDDSTYCDILSAIKKNEALEFLPVIWNDLKRFFSPGKLSFFAAKVAEISELWKVEDETLESNGISSVFKEALDICLKQIYLSENLGGESDISSVVITLLKLNNFDEALSLFKKISQQNFCSLKFSAIELFFNCCLEKKIKDHILMCLKVAEKVDHPEINAMAQKGLDLNLFDQDENYDWIKQLSKKEKKGLFKLQLENDNVRPGTKNA